ncbi:DMT family transporter [Microbulbifer magnicolonia]|uniref:DMT family transporter n=1 Tax=Microbulbifer magnicolonia TaxID=3109744 RepID=UPI002B417CA5|nr:DMT family transporter [Microbulbifer sp. GG15]
MPATQLLRGAIYTSLSMATVVIMAAIVKWASHGFSTELLMVVRWGSGLATFLLIYQLSANRVGLRTCHPIKQVATALFWTGAVFCYYLSLRYIPMLDATLLLNTASLFAPLIARTLGGKKEPPMVWVGIAIGFLGVLVVLRPDAAIFNPMAAVALLSGLLLALRMYFISQLNESAPKQRTTFYSLLVGLLACLLVWLLTGTHIANWQAHLFTPREMLRPWLIDSVMLAAVVALGTMAMLQSYFLTLGLHYASVARVAPFRYTAVILAALLDWIIWGQVPGLHACVGFAIIILGGLLVLRAGRGKGPAH